MAFFLSPILNEQQFTANGIPRAGGLITTYFAGTLTAATTYKTSTGTAQANPIVLDSSGNYPNGTQLWLLGGYSYKFVITDADGSNSRTYDNITGVGDSSVAVTEWQPSGLVPTYVNSTTFTVPNDQTLIFQINRRIQTINTGGTVYSTVSNAVFLAGVTTITVSNTSGVLDSGLSTVSYGFLAADNQSIPAVSEQVSAQTGTTYTYAKGDKGKLVTHTNAAAIAGTLPVASTMGAGWWIDVQNRGAGALTITPTTSTIDGAATLVLSAGNGVRLVSDGTNYFTLRSSAPASMVRVQNYNGYGSTNTMIKRYSNTLDNIGGDITYADSATLGASFTVNVTGTYAFNITSTGGATNVCGISKNSAQLTTAINSITATNRVALEFTNGGNAVTAGNTMYLTAGDVIRPHCDATGAGSAAQEQFTITRVS